MKIQTKLDIGDKAFFLHDKKVIESVVRKIQTQTYNNAGNADKGEVSLFTEVLYLCNKEKDQTVHIKVEEQYAFKSKDELLKSL